MDEHGKDYEGSGLWCWPGCRERVAGGRPGYIVLQSSAQGGEALWCFDLHVWLRVDGQTDGWMDDGFSPVERRYVVLFWLYRYILCAVVTQQQLLK